MYIYLFIIVILFLLSGSRVSRPVTWSVLFLLMIFLCFGYMTGSDWRGYEDEYYGEFSIRQLEPGYMLLSNLFHRAGINFWVFHILFKCLYFIAFVCFLGTHVARQTDGQVLLAEGSQRPHTQFYCGLMMWVASFGFYMLINCPFRNMISCTVVIPAFNCLFQRRYVWYYVLVLLAISFHLSAVLLLFLPLVKVDNVPTKLLAVIYFSVLVVMAVAGTNLVLSLVSEVLPPILQDRILYYDEGMESSVFSVGLVPRLLCLFGILKYRTRIVARYRYGNTVISCCFFYLIVSLVYSVFPMLFRSALYLAPFYILAIVYALDSMSPSFKIPTKILWFGISLAIAFTGVRASVYVPYTNILYHLATGKMYDYYYRDNYNPRLSPYYKFEQ